MLLLGFVMRTVGDDDDAKQYLVLEHPNIPLLQSEYDKMMAVLNRPETHLHTLLPEQDAGITVLFLMSFRRLIDNVRVAPSSSVAKKVDTRSDLWKGLFSPLPGIEALLKQFQFVYEEPFWTCTVTEALMLNKLIADIDREIARRLPNNVIVKAMEYVHAHNDLAASSKLIDKLVVVLSNVVKDQHQTRHHLLPLSPLWVRQPIVVWFLSEFQSLICRLPCRNCPDLLMALGN